MGVTNHSGSANSHMQEKQAAIYYMMGDMDLFMERVMQVFDEYGWEVLLLSDPFEESCLQMVEDYVGLRAMNIADNKLMEAVV